MFSASWRCIIEAGEKFKYLRVAFTSDGRQDKELDVRSGKASAIMRALHHSVVLKRELSRKAKLSVFKSTFVPIHTYGDESWVMTEKVRSQMLAAEMRFLQKIKGVTMFDTLHNTAICESLHIESLLLRIEKSQLRWFGHVSKMLHERLPKQTLFAEVSGKRPVGHRKQDGLIISRIVVGTVWDFIQAKCSLCWWVGRCNGLICSCCSRNPRGKASEEKRRKKLNLIVACLLTITLKNFTIPLKAI